MNHFIGVDVGTGSARAAVFDEEGKRLSLIKREVKMWNPEPGFYQQSSEDIWKAVCECVRISVENSRVDARSIRGIGFDATCSLVAVDIEGRPVSISKDAEDEQNVIVWMDHRAIDQTRRINSDPDHIVFKFVGGKLSPEMQLPKILWLKENLKHCWENARYYFDLPDFLTYKATGNFSRSMCSTVCKWTYLNSEMSEDDIGWQDDFLRSIGLNELTEKGHDRIGANILDMGEQIPGGLSKSVSYKMGICDGTPVGVSIIDAHAGGIGMIGARSKSDTSLDFEKRIALIGGTSSCHMAISRKKRDISGIWGPYFSAMMPGFWLNEGGQSATGSLLHRVIHSHVEGPKAVKKADELGISVFQYLNSEIEKMSGNEPYAYLTKDLHVCPYFHGNRSPRANPNLKGMIVGQNLSYGIDDLCLVYLATIQSIAYGTRHIIETLNVNGYAIDTIVACGGDIKNEIFVREHADATCCKIFLPREDESVLLGSAILGAAASGKFTCVENAMEEMSEISEIVVPSTEGVISYHDRKYKVFLQLYEDQLKYESLMSDD